MSNSQKPRRRRARNRKGNEAENGDIESQENNSMYEIRRSDLLGRCDNCRWPLCSSTCQGINTFLGHTQVECDFLSHISQDKLLKLEPPNRLNFITPLRCLLLRSTDVERWKQILRMEAHDKIRREIPSIWHFNEITVVQILQPYFNTEEIHTVCGILEVNSFEVNVDETSLRALYPSACLMAHNCVPNTMHTNDENLNLKIRATIDIPQGEPITISYAYTLLGTAKRRSHIKQTKFFDCCCARCADPTELGSNMSTILCESCNKLSMMPSSPLQFDTLWICANKKCKSHSLKQSQVDALLLTLESKLEEIADDDIKGYENWLRLAKKYLHENHYLIVGVKYSLMQLYGKIEGYLIQQMSTDQLNKKIQISDELLEIARIVEPGSSRLRGIALYELQVTIMMQIQNMKTKCVPKKFIFQLMKKVVLYLQESSDILQYDSKFTVEGKIGQAARQALEETRDWEKLLK